MTGFEFQTALRLKNISRRSQISFLMLILRKMKVLRRGRKSKQHFRKNQFLTSKFSIVVHTREEAQEANFEKIVFNGRKKFYGI